MAATLLLLLASTVSAQFEPDGSDAYGSDGLDCDGFESEPTYCLLLTGRMYTQSSDTTMQSTDGNRTSPAATKFALNVALNRLQSLLTMSAAAGDGVQAIVCSILTDLFLSTGNSIVGTTLTARNITDTISRRYPTLGRQAQLLQNVIDMSGAGATLDLDFTSCGIGSGACDVELASIYPDAGFNSTVIVRDWCPASCRASDWFLRHADPEFPCADEATAVVASLFQTYLPELELKYDNRIAVSGNTPAVPFIAADFKPDIQSARPSALGWIEPASTGTDTADWASTFAGCSLTGPVYFEVGGSTNVSLGGLAGSISSKAFDNFGCSICKGCHVPPQLSKHGVAVLRSPKGVSNTTASSTSVNVVNYCERSPHYFQTAKLSRCQIMDRCRREWGYLNGLGVEMTETRGLKHLMPGYESVMNTFKRRASRRSTVSIDVPIGYTVEPVPNMSDFSQVQCYFPLLGTTADVNQTCLGGRQHTESTSIEEQPSTEEWAIFFATYEPTVDQALEDWRTRVQDDMTLCTGFGCFVLLILSAMESKHLCCKFCKFCGVPIPFNLTDYRSRRGKFFKAAGVLGMFVFRDATNSLGEENLGFGSNTVPDFQTILIFTALVSGEGSSRALAGSVVGLAYVAFLLYIMSAHLDHLARNPQYDTLLADIVPYTEMLGNETTDEASLVFYKSFRWTSNMASWATLTVLFVFLTIWYLIKTIVYSHRFFTMLSNPSVEPTAAGATKSAGEKRELRRVSESLDMPWNKEHVKTLLRGMNAAEFALKTNSGVALHRSLTIVPRDSDEEDVNMLNEFDDDGIRKLIRRYPTNTDDAGDGLRRGDRGETGCWYLMCSGFQNWVQGRGTFKDACSNCAGVMASQAWDVFCCTDGSAAWRWLTCHRRRTTEKDPTYRYSTRILSAISAAFAYVLLVTVMAVYYLNVRFAHGVLRCALSAQYGSPGLGTSRCDVLGPCGSWLRDLALTWAPEMPLQAIPLSFPCEYPLTTDPSVNPRRPRSFLLCKTADLIVNITGSVFAVFVCIGALMQLLQLRATLHNHKHNIMSLRRGDWSVVPKKMRRTGDLSTISSLMYFVVFVWIQSSFGVLFFMALGVITALVITVPVLAIVPWFDPDTTIYPDDVQENILDYIWNVLFVGTLLMPLLKLMINVAIVFLFFTIGSRHPIVTRNRGLFMWYESLTMVLFIPLVTIKGIIRVLKAMFVSMAFIGRCDVSLMVKGLETKDAAYSSYVAFLLNDHQVSHPVLIQFCWILLETCTQQSSHAKENAEALPSEDANAVQINPLPKRRGVAHLASTRAVTRWHLFITLSHNSTLRAHRKHRLDEPDDTVRWHIRLAQMVKQGAGKLQQDAALAIHKRSRNSANSVSSRRQANGKDHGVPSGATVLHTVNQAYEDTDTGTGTGTVFAHVHGLATHSPPAGPIGPSSSNAYVVNFQPTVADPMTHEPARPGRLSGINPFTGNAIGASSRGSESSA